MGRLLRRLPGAGRAGDAARAVGDRGRHRRDELAGHLPEHTSGYRRAFREREYGSLEHDHDPLVLASPITCLDDLSTPLFVIDGANDPRVPLSEARQIVAALEDKGVECATRIYDDEGHGLAKRANKIDAYPAAIEFVHRHVTPAG